MITNEKTADPFRRGAPPKYTRPEDRPVKKNILAFPALWKKVERAAKREGISVNSWVREAIRSRLEGAGV